jgi:hypothetical protein
MGQGGNGQFKRMVVAQSQTLLAWMAHKGVSGMV